jgi:hypothetical protein
MVPGTLLPTMQAAAAHEISLPVYGMTRMQTGKIIPKMFFCHLNLEFL